MAEWELEAFVKECIEAMVNAFRQTLDPGALPFVYNPDEN